MHLKNDSSHQNPEQPQLCFRDVIKCAEQHIIARGRMALLTTATDIAESSTGKETLEYKKALRELTEPENKPPNYRP